MDRAQPALFGQTKQCTSYCGKVRCCFQARSTTKGHLQAAGASTQDTENTHFIEIYCEFYCFNVNEQALLMLVNTDPNPSYWLARGWCVAQR